MLKPPVGAGVGRVGRIPGFIFSKGHDDVIVWLRITVYACVRAAINIVLGFARCKTSRRRIFHRHKYLDVYL